MHGKCMASLAFIITGHKCEQAWCYWQADDKKRSHHKGFIRLTAQETEATTKADSLLVTSITFVCYKTLLKQYTDCYITRKPPLCHTQCKCDMCHFLFYNTLSVETVHWLPQSGKPPLSQTRSKHDMCHFLCYNTICWNNTLAATY
jgi:hypothetical protein